MPDLFLLSLGESRQEALTGKRGAAEAGWHARLEPGAMLPRRVVLWLQRLFFCCCNYVYAACVPKPWALGIIITLPELTQI